MSDTKEAFHSLTAIIIGLWIIKDILYLQLVCKLMLLCFSVFNTKIILIQILKKLFRLIPA